MADSDEWRRRMAEDLARRQPRLAGGPVRSWPEPRPTPRPEPQPAPAPPPQRMAPAPPPVTGAVPARTLRIWQAATALLTLIVAALIGWLARDLLPGSATPPAPIMPPPSATAPPAAEPVPAPAPAVAETAAPLVEAPPPAPLPEPAPAVPAPAASTPAPAAAPAPHRRTASAAALNCRRAGAAVFWLICNDPALAVRDERLAILYGRAMARAASDPELARRIDRDQTRFYNGRNRCTDAACLARLYDERIARLGAYVG